MHPPLAATEALSMTTAGRAPSTLTPPRTWALRTGVFPLFDLLARSWVSFASKNPRNFIVEAGFKVDDPLGKASWSTHGDGINGSHVTPARRR